MRRAPHVPDAVTGGLDTVGLRVPDQPLALALLQAFGGGVAAPSANRFGRVSPTTAADVRADLGDDVDVVLDGGPCRVGRGVDHRRLLAGRTGDPAPRWAARANAVEELLGRRRCRCSTTGEVRAPGHAGVALRAPATSSSPTRDERRRPRSTPRSTGVSGVGVIGAAVDDRAVVGGRSASPRDGDEYAHDLYRMLRDADAAGLDRVIAVAALPDAGLGAAVADRLRRAAGPR